MIKALLCFAVFFISLNIFSQNWITTGGNNQRNGISEITGPNSVASTYWLVNSTNSSAWGNSVYAYNDKFVHHALFFLHIQEKSN